MSDPSAALQNTVYDLLVEANVANGAVFESVPSPQPLPYCQIGNDIILAAYDSGPFSECTVLVNLLASDKISLKQMVALVRETLDIAIEVPGFITMEWKFDQVRYMTQRDGVTNMAAVEFTYLLQPDDWSV